MLALLADVALDPAAAHANPLAILTFIAAPAVLTNATSVLAMSTSNRFGRNVDRSRALIKILEDPALPPDERTVHRQLLDWLEDRLAMLMRAMSLFYFSIGCFAAGSLTSLLGAIVAPTNHPYVLSVVLGVALLAGVAGLCGLIWGGALLVRETRLALATIRREMRMYRARTDG